MLRLFEEFSLEDVIVDELFEELVDGAGFWKMLLLIPESVWTPPASLEWAVPESSLPVSLGYIVNIFLLDKKFLNHSIDGPLSWPKKITLTYNTVNITLSKWSEDWQSQNWAIMAYSCRNVRHLQMYKKHYNVPSKPTQSALRCCSYESKAQTKTQLLSQSDSVAV